MEEEELELELELEFRTKNKRQNADQQKRSRWRWWCRPSRRRRRRRRRTTMARNQEKANVRFDDYMLSLSFLSFFSFRLSRFDSILLRCPKLTTNLFCRRPNTDARGNGANKNRACSTNGSLGNKSCSPESTDLGADRTTRSNATISLRRINSGLKF